MPSSRSLRACCARVLGDSTLQHLARHAIRTPPQMRASARACLEQKRALAAARCNFCASDARARVHDAPVHAFNRQILMRRAICTPPRTCASARGCLSKSALSLLCGAISMHRMRARIPRIALSLLRGAIFMHRMCACMPIIVFSLLRGAFFMHAKCVRLLPVPGRSNFHRNA